ncbi:MAG TPA: GAF domain-containing sensor histidine kinase [Terriglobia bacterium]|nr:GAF domain-containing sensor histidine kinase [Terriglobia bacterium]
MEDRLVRTERIIAGARLVLALAGINLVVLISGGAVIQSNGAYTAVILYLLYAIAILWLVDRNQIPIGWVGVITQTVDSLWFSIILLYTQGEQSPFLLYYVFSLITASFRWGFKETLLVNTVNVAMYAGVHIATISRNLQFHEFLVRPTYLYVLACLLGYLGEHQKRLHSRLLLLTELSRSIGGKGSFARMLEDLMHRLRKLFQAEQCVIVLHDRENRRIVLNKTGNESPDHACHVVELRPHEAELLLPPHQDWGYLVNPRIRLSAILGWKEVEVYNFETQRPETSLFQPLQALISILDARSLLSAPIVFNDRSRGRVYLINRVKGYFSNTDLQFLRLIITQVAPLMENYRLLRNMQAMTILEEKNRIARDLHDGLVQSLATLDLRLEVCRRLIDCAPTALERELADLQILVKAEHSELRDYMRRLRTSTYPDKDLLEAVQKLADSVEKESGLAVQVSFDPSQLTLPQGLSTELYQIIHEGLTNVRKHAEARKVTVCLNQGETCLLLSITDDGKGFPEAPTGSGIPRTPWSIAERARSLSGTLTVNSVPGHGSTLQIQIPFEHETGATADQTERWNSPIMAQSGEDSKPGTDQVRLC